MEVTVVSFPNSGFSLRLARLLKEKLPSLVRLIISGEPPTKTTTRSSTIFFPAQHL